jgi:prepilin-type N-terminal cleavage/methylation domain-containing protein
MSSVSKISSRGFSLTELLVAMFAGVIVMGGAVQLYSSAMSATWQVQQRSELQQDLRAAEGVMLKDISLAGNGLTGVNAETVPLPLALGTPKFGCKNTAPCVPQFTYPCVGGACSVAIPPALYPIIPGFGKGIVPPGGAVASDVITIAYADQNLALNCYSGANTQGGVATNPIVFNSAGSTLTLTFMAPSNPPSCTLPPGLTYPQALNNTINGLQPGDLIMIGPSANGSLLGIGEVSTVGPANPNNTAPTPCTGSPCAGGSQYVVTFVNGDSLNLNQNGNTNDLSATAASTPGVPITRIYVITYYLANWTDAAGKVTTILYRQVNGQPAVPLADNIANMQFTYDTYSATGTLLNASGDGGMAGGTSPSLIRKVNLAHLTIHSQQYGARTAYMGKGYQGFDVQTSVSTRNMSFTQRY